MNNTIIIIQRNSNEKRSSKFHQNNCLRKYSEVIKSKCFIILKRRSRSLDFESDEGLLRIASQVTIK